ncbi:glycosyltransferase family 4 protein [Brevundimonas sp. 3P9-tot-E]|uniref:glycosyltransferase family 4 protein n=1 Tax=unclassified Brevundimonas TaxID=2622653 RepID=UPI0039A306E0
MRRTDPLIIHHAPLPPARNGIADYTVRVVESLKPHFRQVSIRYNEDAAPLSDAPFVTTPPRGVPLYQIGNNWQHTEILKQALQTPGVVLLHDLQLYYLYESTGRSREQMHGLMAASNPCLSARTLSAVFDKRPTAKLPYLLCNMLPELVARSRKVVVHSQFARNFIIRHLGKAAEDKIHVIPHFAIAAAPRDPASLRERYGYSPGAPLIVTSGFATRAKGFDLVAEAVASLRRLGTPALWLHAGEPEHGDLNLYKLVESYPDLSKGFLATGYLAEDALDDYVAMADVLVNLRFPTVGESSGSLARALAAAACVIVSDTGSYAEIPSSAVLHLPPDADGKDLAAVLSRLINTPALGATLGAGAVRYASTTLALDAYGDALADVLRQAQPRLLERLLPLRQSAPTTLQDTIEWFQVSTIEGAALLAETQSQGEVGQLVYSQHPQNRHPGAYVGIVRRAP